MIKKKKFSNLFLWVLIFIEFTGIACANVMIKNPSFEEDYENDGVPDNWNIPEDVQVELVGKASHGNKAALFSSGYVVASQNLVIENPKGEVRILLDAAGFGDVKLGGLIGYIRKGSDGSRKWVNSRLLWDRKVSGDYEMIELTHKFSSDAEGTKVWIAFYRSNKKGKLLLDNIRLCYGEVSLEHQVAFNRMRREWSYLQERAASAQNSTGDNLRISKAINVSKEIQSRCFQQDMDLLDNKIVYDKKLTVLSAGVNSLLYDTDDIVVSLCNAYERLSPGAVVALPALADYELLSLAGEYQAVGLTIANCNAETVICTISISGINAKEFDCKLRKQAFMETWYQHEKTKVADPLFLLPKSDDSWQVTIGGGETVKLYAEFKIPDKQANRTFNPVVEICTPKAKQIKLPIRLRVVASPVPKSYHLKHCAFIYPYANVGAHSAEVAAKDLADHGVTVMEFPGMPNIVFTPSGKIASVDYSVMDTRIRAYGKHGYQLFIFWQSSYDKFSCADGNSLEPFSKSWKKAYKNMLSDWLMHYAELGFGKEKFIIVPIDEPHSVNYTKAPDENISKTIELCKLTRQAAPDLPILITLSDYAFTPDVCAFAHLSDIILPLWQYRTKLPRNAPATYNPRDEYYKKILPKLKMNRKKTGNEIWSYHIAGGKSDDVLLNNRAYPILAVGDGLTGVGTWAYNVPHGSTWDDTDGGLVDYIFVYDGTENHEFNLRENVAKEIIVPSIRWQALRMGIQDAGILLHLQALADKCNPDLRGAIKSVINEAMLRAKEVANDDCSKITVDYMSGYSKRIRQIYEQVRGKEGRPLKSDKCRFMP